MNLAVWAVILVLQNAAFTWVSRARNSGSIGYHALAAVFSNGIWFMSQFVMIGIVINPNMTTEKAVETGLVYVVSTVIGSISMHVVSMKYLEAGKRKVGAV